MTLQGLKFDSEKLRWDLLPMGCMEEIVKVLTFGARKYAPNNWQLVEGAEERYYAALLRHLSEWRKGNLIDDDSGLSHMSHILCNATFLMWFEHNKKLAIQNETENPKQNTTPAKTNRR
jgi:hypothetical protein